MVNKSKGTMSAGIGGQQREETLIIIMGLGGGGSSGIDSAGDEMWSEMAVSYGKRLR